MPVALIAGAFGQGNPGDEALLDAHLRVLDDTGWDAIVTTRDPALGAGRATVAPQGLEASAALRRTDAVVIGGGTVFARLHPSTGRPARDLLYRTAALTAAARACGRPVAFSGVSASPLPGRVERTLARGIVRATDLLVLRDEESAEILRAAGAPSPFRVGADPAWTVLDAPEPSRRDIDVLVLMSHLASRGVVGWLVSAMAALPASMGVAVAPWQDGGVDAALADAVVRVSRGRGVQIESPLDLADGVSLAASARVALCLRFHGAMACAVAGTPFVAVGHTPKLVALARRLGAPCVEVGCPATEVADALTRAVEAGPVEQEAIDRERRRAHDGLRLLRLLLNDGATYEDASVPSLQLVDGGG